MSKEQEEIDRVWRGHHAKYSAELRLAAERLFGVSARMLTEEEWTSLEGPGVRLAWDTKAYIQSLHTVQRLQADQQHYNSTMRLLAGIDQLAHLPAAEQGAAIQKLAEEFALNLLGPEEPAAEKPPEAP